MALSISDFETIAQLILAVHPDVDEDNLDKQIKKLKRDQEAKLKRDPLKIPAEVDPKRGGRGGGPGRSTGGAALLGGGFAGGLSSGFVTRPLAQGQGRAVSQAASIPLRAGLLPLPLLGGGSWRRKHPRPHHRPHFPLQRQARERVGLFAVRS